MQEYSGQESNTQSQWELTLAASKQVPMSLEDVFNWISIETIQSIVIFPNSPAAIHTEKTPLHYGELHYQDTLESVATSKLIN